MPFVILPTNSASGGYDITNSLRYNSGSSDYLSRTPASAGNRQIFTVSLWTKINGNTSRQVLFWSPTSSSTFALMDSGELRFGAGDGASWYYVTTQLFRDPSAWYHIVFAVDTTQATASNRVKLYVNGSQITSFSSTTNPTQNYSSAWNNNAIHYIGAGNDGGVTYYYGGYMSEFYNIDGQQLTPSSFGETDEDTGIWKPKAYTGTYGTNGFYLQFKNSSSLGTDSSGNGNTFTVNNLTSIDQTTDTPTNNFCTANPLINVPSASYTNGNVTITDGNNTHKTFYSTFGVSTGKWYWEAQATGGTKYTVGLSNILNQSSYQQVSGTNLILGSDANSYVAGDAIGWYFSTLYKNGSTVASGLSTIVTNDIMMIAIDCDAGKIYFGKNGTWRVANSTTFDSTQNDTTFTTGQTYVPAFSLESCSWNLNFGNPSFTIASGNTDGAGFGNFEYAPPSGYYALNTKNLATFG
jgi:hypothetical protein